MDWYRGKKVFVTGGSKGIGREVAVKLAAAGASVVVAARGQASLDETVAAMKAVAAPDARVGAVSLDVTDRPAVAAAAAAALDQLGGLDVLICNSGYAHPGYAHELPDEAFDEMLSVNYLGHVNVVRAFLPHFMAQRSGEICLVSSMLGFMGLCGYSAYSASKFAIVGFGEALRQEMQLHGVRVSVFFPPTTETPGLSKENEVKPAAVWALEADSGFNKTYAPAEVAAAMLGSIRRGRFDAVCGWDSWFIQSMNRYLPGITRWMADRELRTAIDKVAKQPERGRG